MPRTPRRLPAQNTLSYLLLTLTALCGEYPISQISRLPGGPAYLESMVTSLRQSGLLHTFSKDGLRGLRLTSPAKRLLLADAPQWFSDYLTGSSEPNKPKSELSRRLRLHRMAEILTIMHNADIPAFPWERPLFPLWSVRTQSLPPITPPERSRRSARKGRKSEVRAQPASC